MNRTPVALLSAAAIVLSCLIAMTPAAAAPTPSATAPPTGAPESPYRTVIPLDYPVQLSGAATAGTRSPYDVVGYRYLNPGVEGEYYPSEDYTPQDFLAQFDEDFGMTPAVVGLVVRAEKQDDGQIVPITDPAARSSGDLLSGLERFDPSPSDVGRLWDQSRAAEAAADGAPTSRNTQQSALLATDWLPGWTQIAMYTGASDQALISTQHVWTTSNGEDVHVIPDYWAAEFKVALHNEAIEANDPGGLRQPAPIPSCITNPNVKDRFWAKNYDWYSWSVFQVGSATTTSLGAYADINDLSDPCSRQNLSIGIGFPRAIPYTPNGNVQLGTQIVAPKGTVARNRVGAAIEAKEGVSCARAVNPIPPYPPYGPTAFEPDTDCIGVAGNTTWPGPGPQVKLIVNDALGAAYQSAPTTRAKLYTSSSGLPETCVSLWKDLYLDSAGNPVPQRICSAG
jgi:hypothetical protein